MEIDLRLPGCQSLKAKRSVLKPVIEGLRNRHRVAVSEVDHQEKWQRAAIGVAAVSSSPAHASELIEEAERFVWSFPDVDVLETVYRWLGED